MTSQGVAAPGHFPRRPGVALRHEHRCQFGQQKRPLASGQTASELLFLRVGMTGFEPATP
jgi:hypothetical protein